MQWYRWGKTKTCPSVTYSIWTGLVSNKVLSFERSATNHLSHGTWDTQIRICLEEGEHAFLMLLQSWFDKIPNFYLIKLLQSNKSSRFSCMQRQALCICICIKQFDITFSRPYNIGKVMQWRASKLQIGQAQTWECKFFYLRSLTPKPFRDFFC